ncbi:MAG: 50S ribosomal protein L15 [Planctomycetales bacterium]|nr:50S ribosomal protein L15 [Planctomycetales bacterium]
MKLHDVHQGITKNKKRKRLGRGPGSGQGKTSGRGHKGQGSRAGWSSPAVFQGGTMPLVRRVPKRGFTNSWARNVAVVNVGALNETFDAGTEITPELISSSPLLGHRFDELKILGDGDVTKKFTVSAHRFSKSAAEKIAQAGGTVVTLPGRTPVEAKKKLAKQAAAEANRKSAKGKSKK